MKEYQVISVGEKVAWRNGEVCCHSPEGMGLAEVMEIMLNRYAQDGWNIKELFHVKNYPYINDYKVIMIFERSLLAREGKRVKRKRKFVKTQHK